MNIEDHVLDHLRDVVGRPDLGGTRYELLELIGRGGMGAVYRAHDKQLDRDVALKVIDLPGDSASLLAEARLLAHLEHPGIVPVYDAGSLPDGSVFCVMRRVEGVRLDAFLSASPVLSERLNVFVKLCDAIAFAHNRGVIHRDLKPENVMIGSFGQVIVLDWGISLWAARGDRASGTVAGTSRYMSPEQGSGDQVDERSDIFALGVLMDDLLPVRAPRPLTAIAAHARSPERSARYARVEDMAADVLHYQDRLPVSAYAESPWERVVRFSDRNRVLLLLILTYVVVRAFLFFMRPA